MPHLSPILWTYLYALIALWFIFYFYTSARNPFPNI